jgi:hypothetical protein
MKSVWDLRFSWLWTLWSSEMWHHVVWYRGNWYFRGICYQSSGQTEVAGTSEWYLSYHITWCLLPRTSPILRFFCGFDQLLEDSSFVKPQLLLSKSFAIHQSSSHLMLYTLPTYNIISNSTKIIHYVISQRTIIWKTILICGRVALVMSKMNNLYHL